MRKETRTLALRRLLATLALMTVITLPSALTALSYGELTASAALRNEPLTRAASSTAPAKADREVSTDREPEGLVQQLDLEIQLDNSPDAPLIITAASVKAVKTPPVSDPSVPLNRYLISPDVTLQNSTNKQITGLVLRFLCAGSIAARTYSGEGSLNLSPGADYRFKMKPQWDTFTLDGDPNQLTVSVAAVLLQGEELWVNIDQTRRPPEGTLGTLSDRRYSHPSPPSEIAPSTPGTAAQTKRRAAVETVSDTACVGVGCPLNILKMIVDTVGLKVVFKESAEARIQRAGALYLRNLRYGDLIEIILRLNDLEYTRIGNQLTVKPDAFPERLHRLMLAN
jgi:hypothetical protein